MLNQANKKQWDVSDAVCCLDVKYSEPEAFFWGTAPFCTYTWMNHQELWFRPSSDCKISKLTSQQYALALIAVVQAVFLHFSLDCYWLARLEIMKETQGAWSPFSWVLQPSFLDQSSSSFNFQITLRYELQYFNLSLIWAYPFILANQKNASVLCPKLVIVISEEALSLLHTHNIKMLAELGTFGQRLLYSYRISSASVC